MKKILQTVAIAAFVTLAGCQNELPEQQTTKPAQGWENMKIEVTATHPDTGATRALKEGWTNGDRIVTFFNHDVEAYNVIQYDELQQSWEMVGWGEWPGSLTGTVQAIHAGSGDMLNMMYYNNPVQIQAVHGDLHFAEDGTYIVSVEEGSIKVTLDMQRTHTSAIKVNGTGDNSRWRLAGEGLAVHNGMNTHPVGTLVDSDASIRFHRIMSFMYAPSAPTGLMAQPDNQFTHPEMAVFHVMNTDPAATSTTFHMVDQTDPGKYYSRTYQRVLTPGATVVIEGPASAIEAERVQWTVTIIPVPEDQFQQDGVYYRRLAPGDPDDLGVEVVDSVYGDSTQYGYNSYSGVVVIPAQVTHDGVSYPVVGIYDRAFTQSTELTKVVLPQTIESIGMVAFSYCTNLTEVNIPQGVIHIGDDAFFYCPNLALYFDGENPGGYYSDGRGGLMYNATLEWVSPTATGDYQVPLGTQKIGTLAMTLCRFTTLSIPSTVVDMQGELLTYCYDLREVFLSWDSYQLIDVLFAPDYYYFNSVDRNQIIVRVPEGTLGHYMLHPVWGMMPNITETIIGRFCQMDYNTGKEIYYIWSQNPFYPDQKFASVTTSELSGGLPYSGRIVVPPKVWFDGLEFDVTRITMDAFFRCDALTEVVLPFGIIEIEPGAFSNCAALTSLDIPASVRIIGQNNFNFCTDLTEITLGWTADELAEIDLSDDLNAYFVGTDKSAVRLRVPEGAIDAYAAHPLWGSGFEAIDEIIE